MRIAAILDVLFQCLIIEEDIQYFVLFKLPELIYRFDLIHRFNRLIYHFIGLQCKENFQGVIRQRSYTKHGLVHDICKYNVLSKLCRLFSFSKRTGDI